MTTTGAKMWRVLHGDGRTKIEVSQVLDLLSHRGVIAAGAGPLIFVEQIPAAVIDFVRPEQPPCPTDLAPMQTQFHVLLHFVPSPAFGNPRYDLSR